MDLQRIVDALTATTVVETKRKAAEKLNNMVKINGVLPILGDIAENPEYDIEIREAAVTLFKKTISKNWITRNTMAPKICISRQDRNIIRAHILRQVVQVPQQLRTHLCATIATMIKNDFPREWDDLIGSICKLLNSNDDNDMETALKITQQYLKLMCNSRQTEVNLFLTSFFPCIYSRFKSLFETNTEESCSLQHIILKIFYALTQDTTFKDIVSVEVFGQWLTLLLEILKRDLPPGVKELNTCEQSETHSWKCKKWAMKIIEIFFVRYLSKESIDVGFEAYNQFYFEHFDAPVTTCVLSILQDHMAKSFVVERMVSFALTYLAAALTSASTWKIVQPHFKDIIFHMILPAMSPSKESEESQKTVERIFVLQRHNLFCQRNSPSGTVVSILQFGLCRKQNVDDVLTHLINILSDANTNKTTVAGALNVMSYMINKLFNSPKYGKDVENLVATLFTPRLSDEDHYVRFYACCCLTFSKKTSFENENILRDVLKALMNRLSDPNECNSVKLEASITLHYLLLEQEKAQKILQPHVKSLLTELFHLFITNTYDNIILITESIIEMFPEKVDAVTIEIATEIYEIVRNNVKLIDEKKDAKEEKDAKECDAEVESPNLSSALEFLHYLIYKLPALSKLNSFVLDVVKTLLRNDFIYLFEKVMTLLNAVILKGENDEVWEVYLLMPQYIAMCYDSEYSVTKNTDCLYSYIVVDTDKFLSVPERTQCFVDLCERILTNLEWNADAHALAAKHLEVFILQCRGRIDAFLPKVLQITINRLQEGNFEEIENGLLPQLFVVLISAMYYNFDLFMDLLPTLTPYGIETLQWLFAKLFANRALINGVHNQKIILFAVCLMLRLPVDKQPPAIASNLKAVGEFCLELFQRLNEFMNELDANETLGNFSADNETYPNPTLNKFCNIDGNDIDENTVKYFEHLTKEETTVLNELRPNFYVFIDESEIETRSTPLDHPENGLNIYIEFKNSLEVLQTTSPAEFAKLTSMEGEAAEQFKKLLDYCVQQENLVKSR